MAQCACGRSYTMQYTDDPQMDILCPSCKATVSKNEGYLSDHEFVQGSISLNPLLSLVE